MRTRFRHNGEVHRTEKDTSTHKPKYSMTGRLLAGIILVLLGLYFFIEGCVYAASMDGSQFYNIEDAYSSCGVGAVLFIPGAACLFFEIRKRIRIKELFNAGHYVMAEITDVIIDYYLTLRIPGLPRYPYTVMCRYRDAVGEEYMFKSRWIYFDPKPFLQERMVKVYVERGNYKYYYVDIDEVIHKPEYY